MGRRKNPQTREEYQPELDYYEDEMRKCDNMIKLAENFLSKQSRNELTRRQRV